MIGRGLGLNLATAHSHYLSGRSYPGNAFSVLQNLVFMALLVVLNTTEFGMAVGCCISTSKLAYIHKIPSALLFAQEGVFCYYTKS